jgi:hypothetical protein
MPPMKEFLMITAEYHPLSAMGFARTETSAESAVLTGSIAGCAFALFASLMGVTLPMQGPMVAMSPILMTLTGAVFGAMVGGLIGLIAKVALASYSVDEDANRAEPSLFDRVAATVRDSQPS